MHKTRKRRYLEFISNIRSESPLLIYLPGFIAGQAVGMPLAFPAFCLAWLCRRRALISLLFLSIIAGAISALSVQPNNQLNHESRYFARVKDIPRRSRPGELRLTLAVHGTVLDGEKKWWLISKVVICQTEDLPWIDSSNIQIDEKISFSIKKRKNQDHKCVLNQLVREAGSETLLSKIRSILTLRVAEGRSVGEGQALFL